jgi:hypothetical protein
LAFLADRRLLDSLGMRGHPLVIAAMVLAAGAARAAQQDEAIHVVLKTMTYEAKGRTTSRATQMRRVVASDLATARGFTVDPEHGPRTRFLLDGVITRLGPVKLGDGPAVRCEVSVAISARDGRLLGVVTSSATATIPRRARGKAGAYERAATVALDTAGRFAGANVAAFIVRHRVQAARPGR